MALNWKRRTDSSGLRPLLMETHHNAALAVRYAFSTKPTSGLPMKPQHNDTSACSASPDVGDRQTNTHTHTIKSIIGPTIAPQNRRIGSEICGVVRTGLKRSPQSQP